MNWAQQQQACSKTTICKKTRAASGAYFLYKTNRKESKLKFQKQAVFFKVRDIHFFHVVAVVFDCGYDFVDVGVVVADYFGQTRYARRAYFFTSAAFLTASFTCDSHIPHFMPTFKVIFFILSLLSFFCPYCKPKFTACQQNMNKISHFVYLRYFAFF